MVRAKFSWNTGTLRKKTYKYCIFDHFVASLQEKRLYFDHFVVTLQEKEGEKEEVEDLEEIVCITSIDNVYCCYF